MKVIKINTEYITLGQFLKLADIISTGGEAKSFLNSGVEIFVNNELDLRRGRKLRNGDVIKVEEKEYLIQQDED